jgi:hypothetical protein
LKERDVCSANSQDPTLPVKAGLRTAKAKGNNAGCPKIILITKPIAALRVSPPRWELGSELFIVSPLEGSKTREKVFLTQEELFRVAILSPDRPRE